VIPADAPIELWDSGTPVISRPGDTLQTLAAFYGVPLWSLAQINQVPENTPLVPGQRVIVPRRLLPPMPPSRPIVAKQKPSRPSPPPTNLASGGQATGIGGR